MDPAALPKIISVDDHVVEPPHLWQTWLPKKHRARGPKIELARKLLAHVAGMLGQKK